MKWWWSITRDTLVFVYSVTKLLIYDTITGYVRVLLIIISSSSPQLHLVAIPFWFRMYMATFDRINLFQRLLLLSLRLLTSYLCLGLHLALIYHQIYVLSHLNWFLFYMYANFCFYNHWVRSVTFYLFFVMEHSV